jgi:hypothetical protein
VSLDNSTISTTITGGRSEATGGLPATTPASIQITAETVNLTNGAIIKADTTGAAPAGGISFNIDTLQSNVSSDGLPIDGLETVRITSESNDQTEQGGRAGSVTISGPSPNTTDPATLVVFDNTTIETGINGGTEGTIPAAITITAKTLLLGHADSSNSTTFTASTGGNANAGDVTFNVDEMRSDGNLSAIVSITSSGASTDGGTGGAGSVTIQGPTGSGSAASTVSLTETFLDTFSRFTTRESATPGEISITSNKLDLSFSSLNANTKGLLTLGT